VDALTNERLLTVGDVAEMAQVSTRQVWRLRDAGRLPMPVRVGSQIRWRRSDILEWIASGCPSDGEGGDANEKRS
jgi:excisionase family DNA binding protein